MKILNIINKIESVRDSLEAQPLLQNEIDEIISSLKEDYLLDKNIDRSKTVAEILAIFAKILSDYFSN